MFSLAPTERAKEAREMDVNQAIEQARADIKAGRDKEAGRLLSDAVAQSDAAQAREIKELAQQGREMAGILGRGRWKELIRLADLRVSKAA
jgi:hypothetical protein